MVGLISLILNVVCQLQLYQLYLFEGYLISLTFEQYIVEELKPILDWRATMCGEPQFPLLL